MFNFKFDMPDEKKISSIYMAVGIITAVLVTIAIIFLKNIIVNEFKFVESYMEQSVLQTASNLRGRISNSINEMTILATKLPNYTNEFSEGEITKFLLNHIGDYDYRRLVFAYKNGKTVRIQKNLGKLETVSWLKDPRYIKAIHGESVFATTREEPSAPSGYVNEFGVPVYGSDGSIIGVIGSQIYGYTYLEILGYNNYNQEGFSYIINNKGDFVVKPLRDKTEVKNFFDIGLQMPDSEKERIRSMLKSRDSGTFIFKHKGTKYIASFAVIDNADRYVLTFVPLYALMLHINELLVVIAAIVIIKSSLLFALLWYSIQIFKEKEKKIYEIAFTDEITGGGNKNKFLLEAKDILLAKKDENYAMISMDVTKFKAINELFGVEKANKILKDVYTIIQEILREDCICVRDHAAAFIILHKYEKEEFIVKHFIERLIDEVDIYNDCNMKDLSTESQATISARLTLAFGIYLIKDRAESVNQMCERAYIAKRNINANAINEYKFYDSSMMAQILQEKSIEAEMRYALGDKQFKMYLQPKFDLQTKRLSGAEALVRWIHPQRGLVPPMQFIPLFEKNGFVVELDRCIWLQACEFLAERNKQGEPLFPISVNVSRLHMNNDAFIAELVSLTQTYNIAPKYLELELTETACFDNEKRFEEVIKKLKELGFTIAMDDFGTGYSSLTMLRHLPIDILKLDRGFIKDTIDDNKGQIVTKSIVDMANKLNMVTVAEGIEFEEQAEFLRNIGCKIAQGFLYGKPVSTEEFLKEFLQVNV